ncbi:CHAT domain-containing protein [Aquimarina aggregata]|uniref:CHAT domain-containing protein n=1 Tax=Aquimarina aggregata TaxID=1642818 RepID=UPI00249110CB|nr:tetratricopeptide repeat protein [Aquimarina aggregata]
MTITPNNRLVPLLFFCLFIFSVCATNAQTKIDTTTASGYYQKADSLLVERNHKASITLFERALAIYQKAKAWEKVASCYNKISENQWRIRKSKESFQNSKKALEISAKYLISKSGQESYAYDNIGNYYENISDYKKALTYYKKAFDIRQNLLPENHPDIAKSYNNIGLTYYYTSQYKKALRNIEKALTINLKVFGPDHINTSKNYNNISLINSELGNYEISMKYNEKCLKNTIKNYGEGHISTGISYMNIGVDYYYLKKYDDALVNYQKALSIFVNSDSNYELFLIYHNIGTIFSNKGKNNKALEYHKKSLNIAFKVHKKDHPDIAASYQNLGVISQDIGDFNKAIDYFNEALQIYRTTFGENNYNVADLNENIGGFYTAKKEYEIALKYYNKSLEIRNKINDQNTLSISRLHLHIGKVYVKKAFYKNALIHNQKGLRVLQNKYGQYHNVTVGAYNSIASIYMKQQQYEKALQYFDKSLLGNIKNDTLKTREKVLNPNHFFNLQQLVTSLRGKAKTLQSRYKKSYNIQDLAQANTLYKEVDYLINIIRQSFQNYQDKVLFAKQAKEIYADAIKSYLLLYRKTKKEHSLLETFYFAEKSKANTLKELLTDANAKNFTGLSPEILESEKLLKTNRAFYQSQIIDELSNISSDTSKIKEYENELFDINRRQDSLTEVLEKEYPKYYQLKYNNDIVKISDVQKQLDYKTTLLEFFTADSITYAFTVSKNNIGVQKLETPKLTSQIEELKKSIISKNITNFKQKANALYNELIYPIKDKFVGDELIIVPDGPLWHLNFELLLSQNDASENPEVLSYLLKDYVITYANSANLLFNSFKEKALRDEREECLAFSFSDSINAAASKNMSLAVLRDIGDDLPGTRKEIKVISDIIDGQYYFGTEANEANFKKNATRYKILHLALHGEVDNENPENSKLFFTKSKDTIEDNLLYAHELFALDIPSELTVLSACNTGTGKIAKGEGIMSLGNAFQYAGTKSLLLSSWEVPDDTAPELMHYFYTNLKSGMNKGKALQQAKLKYLTTADRYHKAPFYWGGFYLVGDSAPIEFNTTSFWYWILGFCVLAILLICLFYYRRKRI